MKDKKISVVIPVYNAEKYLDRCIKSILKQTYSNWELIAVDDGSADNSLSILKHYAKQNHQINVLHQENKGAGLARNLGIERITGDYLVFIDADDYVEADYFQLLSCHDEDIVFIDVNRKNNKGQIQKAEKNSIYKNKTKDDILKSQMTGKLPWGGVRKAVKRNIVCNNNIKYTHHKIGEEAVFSFEILYHSNTIGFIEKAVYNYEVHTDSLSQSIVEDPWGDVAITIKNRVEELGEKDRFCTTINAFIVTSAIVSLNKIAKKYKYDEYKIKANEKFIWVGNNVYKKINLDKKHMDLKALIMLPFFENKRFGIIYIASKMCH
jgi:glycosyltransferase involved in cell wall biosynthesis